MLTFDQATHTYAWDGVAVPSVTTVLESQGLVTLFGAPEQLAIYRSLGTAVHTATELDDLGTLDEATVHADVWPYLWAWREFKAQSGCELVSCERRVYNEKYGYAGTLDRVLVVRGERGLYDIKTGAKRRATGPQTAAYLAALPTKERTAKPNGRLPMKRYGIYLKNDCTFDLQPYADPTDLQVFLSALMLHTWKGSEK